MQPPTESVPIDGRCWFILTLGVSQSSLSFGVRLLALGATRSSSKRFDLRLAFCCLDLSEAGAGRTTMRLTVMQPTDRHAP